MIITDYTSYSDYVDSFAQSNLLLQGDGITCDPIARSKIQYRASQDTIDKLKYCLMVAGKTWDDFQLDVYNRELEISAFRRNASSGANKPNGDESKSNDLPRGMDGK